MIILITLLCIAIAFALAGKLSRNFNSSDYYVGALISCMVLVLAAGSVPVSRYHVHKFEQQVEVIRRQPSAGVAGDTGWKVYAATINAKIAGHQYENATLWDLWVPDDIDEQEPVL